MQVSIAFRLLKRLVDEEEYREWGQSVAESQLPFGC